MDVRCPFKPLRSPFSLGSRDLLWIRSKHRCIALVSCADSFLQGVKNMAKSFRLGKIFLDGNVAVWYRWVIEANKYLRIAASRRITYP